MYYNRITDTRNYEMGDGTGRLGGNRNPSSMRRNVLHVDERTKVMLG